MSSDASSQIDRFLDYLAAERGLSPNTLAAYRRDLARYRRFLSDRGIDDAADAAEEDVAAFVAHLSSSTHDDGKPYRTSSVARALAAVRSLYRFLAEEGDAPADPTAGVVRPRVPRTLPHPLSVDEVGRILDSPSGGTAPALRDAAILETLYGAGLRVSELVGLDVDDLDLEEGSVRVLGKGSKERRIPIGKSAVHWLQRYLSIRKQFGNEAKPELFLHRGRSLSRQTAWSIVKTHAATAGVPDISPHTLRHSFGTHMMQHGADSRSVQALLGHSDISTTEIYTHITDLHMRKAYDRFHPRARVAGKSAK